MGAAVKQRPKPADLKPGEYLFGTAPGGTQVTLWAFLYEEHSEKHPTRWWFEDCLQPCEQPLEVPFSTTDVLDLLERV
jgi:hypothetical protein